MAVDDRSPAGGPPRIIPMRAPLPAARPEAALRGALARVAAEVVRSFRGLPLVTIGLDVAADHDAGADTDAVLGPVRRLLEAACAAAAAAPAAVGGRPVVREVVVTSIDTGDALEIEVADSAADDAAQQSAVVAVRPIVERAGWTLSAAACPDGGTAVTLRIPRRRGHSVAA